MRLAAISLCTAIAYFLAATLFAIIGLWHLFHCE
jgi:hypothetical protein